MVQRGIAWDASSTPPFAGLGAGDYLKKPTHLQLLGFATVVVS